jgi:hypothetical protein
MQIVVNHVTRMRTQSRICVAGIDPRTHRHIRPITPATDLITRPMLRSVGGPFGPGSVVELGGTVPSGRPPEVEDRQFATAAARHVEDLADGDYLALLAELEFPDITSAFGDTLTEVRARKLAVPKGMGHRSLAVVALEAPELHIDDWGNLYLEAHDGDFGARLRVTDVRFYEPDHSSIKVAAVESVNQRLQHGVDFYVMLGLARAMLDRDAGSAHWLQCNGICLVDRAVSDTP